MNGRVKEYFRLPPPLVEEIRITAAAFLVLIAAGFAVSFLLPETVRPLLSYFTASLDGAGVAGLGAGELLLTLLLSNAVAAFAAILCGFIPFLRLSAFSLGLNAVLLGVFASYYQSSGPGLAAYFAGTLPHGLTELVALAISCAAGLYLCRTVTDRLLGRETGTVTVAEAWEACKRAFVRYVLPLLLFSALVETFVTPHIMSLFL